MIIGIDASRANAERRTGTEWYSFHLIQDLKRYDVPGLEVVLYSKEALRDGLEVLPEGWSSRILGWPLPRFWNQGRLSLELLRRKVDLFFQPTHTLPLIRPKRIVATLHDIGFERLPQLYTRAELRYHRHSAKLAVKRANRILTVSDFSRREILDRYKLPEERVTAIPLGYDAARYRPDIPQAERDAALRRHRLSKPFFLYVGRIEAKKNIANLVHAFSIFKGWRGVGDPVRLFLAGSEGHGAEAVKKEIAARGIGDFVMLPGYVPEEDLPALMAAADAVLLPSWYEGFGLPVIQAQACGAPVIASSAGSLPEVAGPAALFVSPDAPEEMARAMKEIASASTLRARLVELGFENAKNYSWKETGRRTMNVLLEVLGLQMRF